MANNRKRKNSYEEDCDSIQNEHRRVKKNSREEACDSVQNGHKRVKENSYDKDCNSVQNRLISYEEACDSLQKVQERLKRILAGSEEEPISAVESMTLYTMVFNLSSRKDGPRDKLSLRDKQDKLYAKHRELLKDYIVSVMMPAIQATADEVIMLRELVNQSDNYFKVVGRWMCKFFGYLDRYYAPRFDLPTLQEVTSIAFHDLVYKEMHCKAREAVISLIDKEREGEEIDRALLKKALDIFVGVGMKDYKEDFEEWMIGDTDAYYSRKASRWILEDSCPDYMRKVEECLGREKERVAHYLHSSSEKKLIERVKYRLLVVFKNQHLDNEKSGCLALFREERVEDLSRMFRLFREIPGGLEPMAKIFKQHITHQGKALVQQLEEAARNKSANKELTCFRKLILDSHDQYMKFIMTCFSEHKVFYKALRDAFEEFCNKVIAGTSSVEQLATFCDNLIKNSDNQRLSNEAIEGTLDKVSKILVYFNDKDLFIEFYRKKLARRLLFDKSGKEDHDRNFLIKLKHQYGASFTSKPEGMLTDVTLAEKNHRNFQDWFESNPSEKPNFDFSITTLTTGCWPSYKSSDLKLPWEMAKGVEAYVKFYQTKTSSRKLTWIYSLGSCHINGKFEQKTIELIVSTYQASALLLFNDTNNLTFSEIQTRLNLSHDDVVRVLHSLSCGKYKILNKEPKTETICDTDSFEFNTKFTDIMRRISIPLPPVDETKKITEDVNEDRRHHIDAALVRIMKSRKVLGHQELVSECVELLSKTFKPEIKAIKRRIEDLIGRDFIGRENKNPNMFIYLP